MIPNDLLIRAKEALAHKWTSKIQNTATGNMRIPVGQREVAHMVAMQPIVRDLSEISHRDWILQIEGLVQNPLKLTYEDLLLLPKSEPTYDIHCVTSWTKLDQQFSGVDFGLILEMVQPLAEAKHVIFESVADAYSTNVVLAELQAYPSLLAYEIEGAPIELRYGWPVRMVIPHLYYWKSSKYVTKIRFVAEDEPGFWEVRGYHNHADPWGEERYSD